MTQIIRSVLFVPGNQPERIAKALATEADAVIMDLEDAVPLAEKENARRVVGQVLQSNRDRKPWVRVNGPETEWIGDDIETVTTQGIGGIMVPKLETPEQVTTVSVTIAECTAKHGMDSKAIALIPLIETALSVQNVYSIASTAKETGSPVILAFGAADFTADMGINMTATGEELHYPRARMAVACRAAGVRPPLDTPFMIDLKDQEGLREDAQRARNLGFQGKLCIHPAQLKTVNEVFSPSSAEIEYARRVIEAHEASIREGKGAVQVDGKFIDAPIVARAGQIVKFDQSKIG